MCLLENLKLFMCLALYSWTSRNGLPRWFSGKKKKKNPPTNSGDTSLIPGLGRAPGGENGIPLQCSCLEHPMGRGAWCATVHGSQSVRYD